MLAKGYMRRELPDHTLQPTALINEAYIRMVGNGAELPNHQHFIGVAANVMRRCWLITREHTTLAKEAETFVGWSLKMESHFRPNVPSK